MRFDELNLSDEVLDALYDMHFDECTPIQEQAIPVVLEGRDLIACAQTGTGKTAAYLLPMISRLYTDKAPTDAINCVVMAPTRELAQQIDRQMEGFSYFLPISSVAVYGGTDGKTFAQQQRGLKLGADVVIATPGRLLAHLQMGYVDLSKVSFFILDEADRMLDMGFYDDIMQVVKHLPKERQTLMFSATMPPKIQKLAATILNNPAEVKIAVAKPGENIDQSAVICYEAQKTAVLKYLFKTVSSKRVIVFASSKLKVKELTRELRRKGYNVGEIHSDLEQTKRDEVLHEFRAGRIDALIATDIVARGIDIDDITMVVNYDVPHEAEDYVHRIGRTARAGADGRAVTFVSEKEQRDFAEIERFLEKEVRKMELPAELGETPAYRGAGARRDNKRRTSRRNGRSSQKPAQKPVQKQNQAKPQSENPQGDKKKSSRPHYRRRRGNGGGNAGK
jgi:superfamily II DNA/RNA helicase